MTFLVFLGIIFAWALFTEPHAAGRRSRARWIAAPGERSRRAGLGPCPHLGYPGPGRAACR